MPVDRLADAVQVRLQLAREAALADARLAGHGDQPQPLLAGRGVEHLREHAQLGVTAHEGQLQLLARQATADAQTDTHGPPGLDRHGLALERGRSGRFVDDGPLGGQACRLRDEHAARLGVSLEAAGGVDEVAGDHALALGTERHGRLAGDDGGAGRELPVHPGDGGDEVQRRADGPLGVVLVSDGHTPHRHDGVADELLDAAAIAFDALARQLVVGGEQLTRLLGVARLRRAGEAHQVAEEDRHETALRLRAPVP